MEASRSETGGKENQRSKGQKARGEVFLTHISDSVILLGEIMDILCTSKPKACELEKIPIEKLRLFL